MPEVGNLNIECATCGMPLIIPISAEMAFDDKGAYVDTSSDVSGLWLHVWDRHAKDAPSD